MSHLVRVEGAQGAAQPLYTYVGGTEERAGDLFDPADSGIKEDVLRATLTLPLRKLLNQDPPRLVVLN